MNDKLQVRKSATAMMDPHKQNLESVHRIVDRILGLAGCDHCGRIALLNINFLIDPPPELGKEGIISFEKQGF
jgi:hypothetical protein